MWKGRETSAEEMRRQGALIHQDPGRTLNPVHSIAYSFKEALLHLEVSRKEERLDEVLENVRLPRELLPRKPHALSGGQKQRVAIARALLGQPAFMLCDEPFSSLDPALTDNILELIVGISRSQGTSIVLVAHDRVRLEACCDRILVMEKGCWVSG